MGSRCRRPLGNTLPSVATERHLAETYTPEGYHVTMEIRLDLEGMHCASCAARIEKQLNRLDGVEATVNLATEQATVHCPPERRRRGPRRRRRRRRLPRARRVPVTRARPRRAASTCCSAASALAVVLTIPVALLAMVPALRFAGWEWVALALSTPVVFYAGRGVPPRGAQERAPPRRDDGHADLARHPRGLDVVGRRARGRRSTPTPTSRSPRS